MSMDTNLPGRLRNTNLKSSQGLMPLFEAVINSIHSIEEAGLSSSEGRIIIEILRSKQMVFDFNAGQKKPGPDACGDIDGFKITDNGIGFTEENMISFQTLDSDHKKEKGCRGVGRLYWLKAFEKANISSVFKDNNHDLQNLTFSFDKSTGVSSPIVTPITHGQPKETIVHLDGFGGRYQKTTRKTAAVIADSLFEHCLWYFVRPGGAPTITIVDESATIDLANVFDEHMLSDAYPESIPINNISFDLIHVKLRRHSSQSHVIAYCAASRVVKTDNIKGKIPGLYGKIKDEKGDFIYACYVSSSYLDERVHSERTDFNIEEDLGNLLSESEISFKDIRKSVMERASIYLSAFLAENKEAGRNRVENFVSQKAPRYRPILARITAENLSIDPSMLDKDLELTLHKLLAEIENKLLADGHDIMNPKASEEPEDYLKRLQTYLDTAEDLKKSDLANYVFHRKVILDLLGKAIERQGDGKYVREDLIHSLIMPMGKDSNQVSLDSCNLWLLDERLAFHNFLASDKPLSAMPITGSNETKEPDICALNIFDNPILAAESSKFPLASIVVVEIKRPMRNDAQEGEDKNPIEQAHGYLDRIRKGRVKTAQGRPIPASERIPGFCFIICDLTPTMVNRCRNASLNVTSDGMGYFGYNPNYSVYTEVISFDRLVNAAKERNRAFFDKLGLPTT